MSPSRRKSDKEDEASTALEQRLGQVEVPEARYKVDIELHDRSIQFSAELLRIALAGLAVVGWFVAKPEGLLGLALSRRASLKLMLSATVVAFAGSAACALAHRFFAGGSAFHHLQVIKLLRLGDPKYDANLQDELQQRKKLFEWCHSFLIWSWTLLVVAAGLLGAAFIRSLFS